MRLSTFSTATFGFAALLVAEARSIERRTTVPALHAPWTAQGCHTDSLGSRTLIGKFGSDPKMTIPTCLKICDDAGYSFAGLEFSTECHCGYSIEKTGKKADDAKCHSPCGGNADQPCGGSGHILIFGNGRAPPTNPGTVDGWKSHGCHTDAVHQRALPLRLPLNGTAVTIPACAAACGSFGFKFAGLEYTDECWCGNAVGNGHKPAPEAECNMACQGNKDQRCGGPDRISIYETTPPPPPPPVPSDKPKPYAKKPYKPKKKAYAYKHD
ncbi:hypothetical protein HGRIS_007028 [Hohenbuehelia grisea]|uniref:WSC domain-containing protein n=1 Tax=Hohenbuehelia grisea TaxID=104357 RepID=A0ABR3JAU1_9AGAR